MDDEIEQVETGYDTLRPMDTPLSDTLMEDIGWRADTYDFEFYTACIMGDFETPSASWIEVAYSRQLGGCFVVWFSGVSTLEAPDLCSYGWIDCRNIQTDFPDAFLRRSLLQSATVPGYHFNAEAYYDRLSAR